MKLPVLLVGSLLVVGVSAIIALGPKILIYPAAWAIVAGIFIAWNAVLGPSTPESSSVAETASSESA
ncbi:MAG: hypothetical protein MI757_20295 [Pirellulales bacterium]|nr:hypothetical protein [Pirellulales bacterium]